MTARDRVVNGAFRPQRITGQQRYAREIADRLVAHHGFGEYAPERRWAGSAVREWAWATLRLPALARGRVLLSLTSRAPVLRRQVLVVHDLFVLTNPEWFSRTYVLTHAPILSAQLRRAAAVVAVSEPTADAVRARYPGKVVVAPNAPSSVFTHARERRVASVPRGASGPPAPVLARYGLTHGSYLLTVGSRDPRKNLPMLADAYGMLPQETREGSPLVVVGGGAAIYRGEPIDWPEGTVQTGYVTDEDLAELYAGARAVVFPSRAEGFGLPLVEAAAAGAGALVVSDLPVFRWICGDGAIYVDPASVSSIGSGLRSAIDGEAPPISIELSRFAWDSSAREVAKLCEDVAGSR